MNPLHSYVIYDRSDRCPLSAYIELICDGNLRALVVEGDPGTEILEAARMKLIWEYYELTGNAMASPVMKAVKDLMLYRNRIRVFELCKNLINTGSPEVLETVVDHLSQLGIRTSAKVGDQVLISNVIAKIESKVNMFQMHLKNAEARYSNHSSEQSGSGQPSPSDFYDQLAYIHIEFNTTFDTSVTLAMYASYIKQYQRRISLMQSLANGK